MWMATSGVHRMKRRSSLVAKALVSVAAATAAGALSGWAVALCGQLLILDQRAQLVLVLAGALIVSPLLRVRLPQRDVETPQALLSRGPLQWAVGNGALLGLGVASRIGFWAWYVLPLGVFALGGPVLGAILWGTYGFTRLSVLAVVAVSMRHGDDAASRRTAQLIAARTTAQRSMRWLAVVAAVVIAVTVA
jgi:hypothetical protein